MWCHAAGGCKFKPRTGAKCKGVGISNMGMKTAERMALPGKDVQKNKENG